MNTLFFDIGGVLLFFSHEKMCRQIADLFSLSFEEVNDLLFKQGLGKQYELGLIKGEDIYEKLIGLSSKNPSIKSFTQAACDIFQLNYDILPILKKLKKNKTELIVISNTNHAHIEYIRKHFSVLDYFDDEILSFKIGMLKPDPNIFKLALRKTNSSASSCFYIDDVKDYIEVARSLGLQGHHFQNNTLLKKKIQSMNFSI